MKSADFLGTLHRIALDVNCHPSARVQAAAQALSALLKVRELDLNDRLERLERAAQENREQAELDALKERE